MNNNEEENPRDDAIPTSESSPYEEMTEEATEKSGGPADDTPADTELDFDEELGELTGDNAEGAAAPGKDWLVDTGLAAAINPQTDVPEESPDDYEEDDARQENAESVFEEDEDGDGDENNSYVEDDSDDDDYEDVPDDPDDDDEDFEEAEQAYLTDDPFEDSAPPARSLWPMVVGGIALVLIGVGGWDLFQERATLQTRIVELEQNQARARDSEALDAKTVSELEVENAALKLQLDSLYEDYNAALAALNDISVGEGATGNGIDAGGAEADLDQPTASDASNEERETSDMALSDAGEWFINIGAYANSQSAETWVLRLENSGYDVSVTEIQTAEGDTLKRVRLTSFDSKSAAQVVAQELETDYGTGPLWVGAISGAD